MRLSRWFFSAAPAEGAVSPVLRFIPDDTSVALHDRSQWLLTVFTNLFNYMNFHQSHILISAQTTEIPTDGCHLIYRLPIGWLRWPVTVVIGYLLTIDLYLFDWIESVCLLLIVYF